MANPALLQRKTGKCLWLALLGLGFQPDVAASSLPSRTTSRHIILGANMFDKPNKDAFHIVARFLLERLDPARFNEAFRSCWPIIDNKQDVQFRKVTCAWLRELMEETKNAGSKVVASLFLSPGGLKFTSLMLHLAKRVMLQDMKTFDTDGSWTPEAAAGPASSLGMAAKRLQLIKSRFLKGAVQQDHVLQEYQARSQVLVKSMKDLKAESAKYDELLKRYDGDSTQGGDSLAEKMKMVRSLWSSFDGMLSTVKDDRRSLECVLEGAVDQYTLDGTDRALKIPQNLVERIEKLPHQLSSGNVYEGGQLNLLCVLELTNHTLQLLKEEQRCISDTPGPPFSPPNLQEKRQQMARTLQSLHLIRQKINKEEIPEVRRGIVELEAEWDRKWKETLKDMPLVSFLNEDPALGFLSPMARLSFEPAAEASYGSSVFSQYQAKLPERCAEMKLQETVGPSSVLKSSCRATDMRNEDAVATADASSRVNTSLDWIFDTPPSPRHKTPSVPPPQASTKATARFQPNVVPIKAETQILTMECDNLADQFAEAVTTESPTDGRVKGLDLEGILSTLHGDPFSTRKQLTRTPESLILDVKSSWRKALEEDKVEKMRQASKYNDSITGRITPLEHPCHESPSPPSASHIASCHLSPTETSHSSPPASQQGDPLKSSLSWSTLDGPSGSGSHMLQFSLDHETLPSCDSLLSLEDNSAEEEEEDELLLPSLKSHMKPTHQHLRQPAGDVSLFVEHKRTSESLLLDHKSPGLDTEWLLQPTKGAEPTDKVFSLDLDDLDRLSSPPKKQEYSLPKLITFSPIDDIDVSFMSKRLK